MYFTKTSTTDVSAVIQYKNKQTWSRASCRHYFKDVKEARTCYFRSL